MDEQMLRKFLYPVTWFISLLVIAIAGTGIDAHSKITFFWVMGFFIFMYTLGMSVLIGMEHSGQGAQDLLNKIPPIVEMGVLAFLTFMMFCADIAFATLTLTSRGKAACAFGWFLLPPLGVLLFFAFNEYRNGGGGGGAKGAGGAPDVSGPTPAAAAAPTFTDASTAGGPGAGATPGGVAAPASLPPPANTCDELWTSIYAYQPQDAYEIGFPAGATIHIFSKEDPDWWRGDYNGAQGQVPSNYLKPYVEGEGENNSPSKLSESLAGELWFHGLMSRELGEAALMQPELEDGAFLMRESENRPGTYTLSVKYNGKVSHFKVAEQNGQYDVNGRAFNSLPEIIQVYTDTPIVSKSGVNTRLTTPCPKGNGYEEVRLR